MSKTLLIIEDDVVTRDLLQLVFEYDGFNCIQAENGAVGLTLIEEVKFDLIILDNMMPKMTGLEFLSHRRSSSQTPDIPIIMITGLLNEDVHEQATKLGVYAIIGKPYDLGELRALANQLSTPIPSGHREPAPLQM